MSTKFILSCSFDNGAFEEFDTEQEFLTAIQQLIKESKSDVFVLDGSVKDFSQNGLQALA